MLGVFLLLVCLFFMCLFSLVFCCCLFVGFCFVLFFETNLYWMLQLQWPVYYMYGLDCLNLCNPFKNRLQNAKDFLSLPALLKFSLRQCSSESLPVSCLQNIHIQSTISTIAINKEPFMPTCYNFILHTLLQEKGLFSSFQYQ